MRAEIAVNEEDLYCRTPAGWTIRKIKDALRSIVLNAYPLAVIGELSILDPFRWLKTVPAAKYP